MWNQMEEKIRKVAKVMLGDSEVLDLRVKNHDGGMKVTRVKLK